MSLPFKPGESSIIQIAKLTRQFAQNLREGSAVGMLPTSHPPVEEQEMPRATKKITDKEPIYTWAFQSSKPHGGTVINYIAQLNQDKTLSCNCPGWIFAKKNQERSCKHTKQVEPEVKAILQAWKNGEVLPVLHTGSVEGTGPSIAAINNTGSKIQYGRVIEI